MKNQWNLNKKSYIFSFKNMLENVELKIAAILSRPQYVNNIQQQCIRIAHTNICPEVYKHGHMLFCCDHVVRS